jgi:hypothetical protein
MTAESLDICESRRWCTPCRRDVHFRTQFALPAVCPHGVTVESATDQKPIYPAERIRRPGGPGTELKGLLKDWLGITSSPGCSCNSMAAEMDRRGTDWCESDEGLAKILGVMKAEHAKRWQARQTLLPWSDTAATALVRLAVHRARSKAAS